MEDSQREAMFNAWESKHNAEEKAELKEITNQPLLIESVSGSATTSGITTDTTTDTTTWKGGYVTDNFQSYYLDENMVKHYR